MNNDERCSYLSGVTQGGQAVASAMSGLLSELQSQIAAHNAASPNDPNQQWALVPERLPSLVYNDLAYYVQWTDAGDATAWYGELQGKAMNDDCWRLVA